MGVHKKDHIRALLRVKTGGPASEAIVEELFAEFIPMQMECLAACSAVIPGVVETVEELRARGIKIGSTTGYTRPMLEVLLALAAQEGYAPDCALCPDDAGAGRPWPWMCYLNAIQLKTYPMYTMIKIGDTVSDIEEGENAGMWTMGVARTGNMIGLTAEQLAALPLDAQAARACAARREAGVSRSPLRRRCGRRFRSSGGRDRRTPGEGRTPVNRRRLAVWQGLTIALLFIGYAGYYLCRSDFSVSLPLIIDELAARGMTPAEAKIRLGRHFILRRDGLRDRQVLPGRCGRFPGRPAQFSDRNGRLQCCSRCCFRWAAACPFSRWPGLAIAWCNRRGGRAWSRSLRAGSPTLPMAR